jgi:uncharacterized protein YdaU (DUF1376 family)
MLDDTKWPRKLVLLPGAGNGVDAGDERQARENPRRKQGKFPFMPVHVKDAYAETRELSTAGQAAYFSLTCQMWMHGGWLPDDDTALARMVGCTKRRWQKVRPELLKVFEVRDGYLTHPLLSHEYQRISIIAQKRSAIARVRWNNYKDLADANGYAPTPTQDKRRLPRRDSPLRELPSPAKYHGNGAATLTEGGKEVCSAIERLRTAREKAR